MSTIPAAPLPGDAEQPNEPGSPQTAQAPQPLPVKTGAERPRPRTSPIVWGAIVLVFCVYCAVQLVAPGSVDGTTFIIATTVGLGVLLLVVGAAVLVRNARTPGRERDPSS